MNRRIFWALSILVFVGRPILGGGLTKDEKQHLKEAYNKQQAFYLLQHYLEGDFKGLHVYNVRPNAAPEFVKSWRDTVNVERRLLRGDKLVIESVSVHDEYLEIRIKAVERKSVSASSTERLVGAMVFGLPGMAAGQGKYEIQPQAKLRFFGTSAQEIRKLVSAYFSAEPPRIELQPGMSSAEVKQVLGEPTEVFVLGNKQSYKYPNMEVRFEDDKLLDVVFEKVGTR